MMKEIHPYFIINFLCLLTDTSLCGGLVLQLDVVWTIIGKDL